MTQANFSDSDQLELTQTDFKLPRLTQAHSHPEFMRDQINRFSSCIARTRPARASLIPTDKTVDQGGDPVWSRPTFVVPSVDLVGGCELGWCPKKHDGWRKTGPTVTRGGGLTSCCARCLEREARSMRQSPVA
jgi:hypothetical protein